jgi:hypothetical protein
LIGSHSLTDPTIDSSQNQTILDVVIPNLTRKFSLLWNCVSDAPCLIGKTYGEDQQRENELNSEDLLLDAGPQSMNGNGVQKHIGRLRDCVRDLVLETVDQERREQIEEMLTSFSDAGDDFVARAREFDKDLQFDGIFQALRNLWIINSMQEAFELPICANPSGFAYSLLYTYSDNYLDSTAITQYEKQEFGNTFRLRLSGFEVPKDSALVSKVSSLVDVIEKEYPRALFPEVYSSLLAIHHAQQRSLLQRWSDPECEGTDILSVSVEKGGTSVVADAYLAKGRLIPAETEFAFGYGVFLQFIDDLQDVKEDFAGGSESLFTTAAQQGKLDSVTNRLLWYLREVLFSTSPLHGPRADGLTELILQGSVGLILESIALNPEMFSEEYVKTAELFSPLRFKGIRKMHQKRESIESRFISPDVSWAALNSGG